MTFQETRPKGPIAAMYSSPGPVYCLPGLVGRRRHDPRSVHYRGPEWCFGIKSGKYKEDCGPGPGSYAIGRHTRYGADGTPQYSIYGRNRDLTTYRTPGPGAYSSENCTDKSMTKAPSWSMSGRHRDRRTDDTPGPNKYSLPVMTGGRTVQGGKKTAPCPIIASRNKQGGFDEDLTRTPGPGAYKVVDPDRYLNALPKYTMTGRNGMPGDSTKKPGPGAYDTTKRGNAPGPSFGIRWSPYVAPLIAEPSD